MVTPEDDVEAVPVIRPWASRLVVVVPLVVEVLVILPCASRKVVLSVFDCEAVPVVLPWASLKVVVVPDVLVVVEDLPFSSLSVAFLPARVEAGSAKARRGNRRTRISFMEALDVLELEIFTSGLAQSHGAQRLSLPGMSKPWLRNQGEIDSDARRMTEREQTHHHRGDHMRASGSGVIGLC